MADTRGSAALSRRRFLHTAAGAGATAALGAAGASMLSSVAAAPASSASSASVGPAQGPDPAAPGGSRPSLVPFPGIHQAGIDRPAISQAATIHAALDVVATDRPGLDALLRELTRRIRHLADAQLPPPSEAWYPPDESGILGSAIGPADLSVTVGVGASLFDGRFGLADRRPRLLAPMPAFPNDQLDAGQLHGDLSIGICAVDAAACLHALRYLMQGTRSSMTLRWMVEGFQRPNTQPGHGRTTTRNLLGFKDGTSNLVPGTDELAARVWVAEGDDEPAWTVGGSYQVIRIIRMFVERWDRTALDEQEAIFGRTKRTGAPLGGGREEDEPDYASDPEGRTIPLDAHIRLAHPRTAETAGSRILRRGYSYSRGFDAAGQLDQGLLFVCYQRDLAAGFETVQRRLDGEPLEEYIRPVGGGYFFALPGVTGDQGSLGDALLG